QEQAAAEGEGKRIGDPRGGETPGDLDRERGGVAPERRGDGVGARGGECHGVAGDDVGGDAAREREAGRDVGEGLSFVVEHGRRDGDRLARGGRGGGRGERQPRGEGDAHLGGARVDRERVAGSGGREGGGDAVAPGGSPGDPGPRVA